MWLPRLCGRCGCRPGPTHHMPGAPPTGCAGHECFQIVPRAPWGAELPLIRTPGSMRGLGSWQHPQRQTREEWRPPPLALTSRWDPCCLPESSVRRVCVQIAHGKMGGDSSFLPEMPSLCPETTRPGEPLPEARLGCCQGWEGTVLQGSLGGATWSSLASGPEFAQPSPRVLGLPSPPCPRAPFLGDVSLSCQFPWPGCWVPARRMRASRARVSSAAEGGRVGARGTVSSGRDHRQDAQGGLPGMDVTRAPAHRGESAGGLPWGWGPGIEAGGAWGCG